MVSTETVSSNSSNMVPFLPMVIHGLYYFLYCEAGDVMAQQYNKSNLCAWRETRYSRSLLTSSDHMQSVWFVVTNGSIGSRGNTADRLLLA